MHKRSGSHYEYRCENQECGVLLQGDFKAYPASPGGIGIGPIVPCEHPEKRDSSAPIFWDTEALAKARRGATSGFRETKS